MLVFDVLRSRGCQDVRLAKNRQQLSLSLLSGFESIQPKQRASSAASSQVTQGFPLSM